MIEHFTQHQHSRGFSERTVTRRAITLRAWKNFLAPLGVGEATHQDVLDFLERWPNPSTRHAYRSDLAAFYTWAARRGLVATNPMELVDGIRVPQSLPRPIPAAMVMHLFATAPTADLQTVIALAAFAGLRASEIAAITADCVDLQRGTLMVRNGKGAKDRMVPLHPLLAQVLRRRLGKSGNIVNATARTLSKWVADHMRANGIEDTGRWTHRLRASFATELGVVTRGNVVMMQRLMGHKNPTTTMQYVGWDGGEASGVVGALYGDEPPDAA